MTKRCLRTDPHDCFLGRHLDPPKPVRISEKDFQRQVLELARLYRWHAYHPALSKWSERGWPDLALVRPPRLVFAIDCGLQHQRHVVEQGIAGVQGRRNCDARPLQ